MEILGKRKTAIIAEVENGRYPPCIYYQVLYSSVAERRRIPAFWRAELHGADVKLFFSCNVLQELGIMTVYIQYQEYIRDKSVQLRIIACITTFS